MGTCSKPGHPRSWARKSAALIYLLTQICKSRKRSCKILPFLPAFLGERSSTEAKPRPLAQARCFPLSIIPESIQCPACPLPVPCCCSFGCVAVSPNGLGSVWAKADWAKQKGKFYSQCPLALDSHKVTQALPWGNVAPLPSAERFCSVPGFVAVRARVAAQGWWLELPAAVLLPLAPSWACWDLLSPLGLTLAAAAASPEPGTGTGKCLLLFVPIPQQQHFEYKP